MKNPLLILNFVLLLLIAVLFYLHFSSVKSNNRTIATKTVVADTTTTGPFSIAYFEMDSIENNYEYLKDVRNQLKVQQQQLSAQLNQMKNRYMEKVNKFQQEGRAMTQEKQSAIQQDLLQEQKIIQNKEQSVNNDLQDASYKKMRDVNQTIEEFLKDYNKDKHYSYILAYSPGTIYYKDERYNITAAVLQGLNEGYKKKK